MRPAIQVSVAILLIPSGKFVIRQDFYSAILEFENPVSGVCLSLAFRVYEVDVGEAPGGEVGSVGAGDYLLDIPRRLFYLNGLGFEGFVFDVHTSTAFMNSSNKSFLLRPFFHHLVRSPPGTKGRKAFDTSQA